MKNLYYIYKNTEPMNRAQLTDEEMELILQLLHNRNAEGEDETVISLLTKLMEALKY
jgi:hypothetical protein